MATNVNPSNVLTYRAIGLNIDAAISQDGKFAYIRVPLSAQTYQSETGKMDMLAKTNGGWSDIAGLPDGRVLRGNVMFGFKAHPAAPAPTKGKSKGKAS